ncbi:MAG: hypothetical protein KAI99_00390 [Cyclobacteriaceae bacterium]|nr:hypothetical protein [Cyclobacteriaceae bacterium]
MPRGDRTDSMSSAPITRRRTGDCDENASPENSFYTISCLQHLVGNGFG